MKAFIETERLILREIILSDKESLFELDTDPAVHQYLGHNPLVDMEQVEEMISNIRQQYIDNGIGRWAVVEKSTGDFLGWGGFKLVRGLINNHTNYYDLGYRLIKRYWGKGFATELANGSLKYGFEKLMLDKIHAFADAGNKGSRHVLEKAGLHFIEKFDYEGEEHDWFEITRSQWDLVKSTH